jgi:hypothetical protein
MGIYVDYHDFDDGNICGLGFTCSGSKENELRKLWASTLQKKVILLPPSHEKCCF